MNFVIKLLPFICNHEFVEQMYPNQCRPAIYCKNCGKIKELPTSHNWEKTNISYQGGFRNEEGTIKKWEKRVIHLKCTKCGERETRDG